MHKKNIRLIAGFVFCSIVVAVVWFVFDRIEQKTHVKINLSSPEAAFETYKEICHQEDIKSFYKCISTESKEKLFKKRRVTPRQLNNAWKTMKDLKYRILINGSDAVVIFDPPSEYCAPFLLTKESDFWTMDLLRMNKTYVIGPGLKWQYRNQR